MKNLKNILKKIVRLISDYSEVCKDFYNKKKYVKLILLTLFSFTVIVISSLLIYFTYYVISTIAYFIAVNLEQLVTLAIAIFILIYAIQEARKDKKKKVPCGMDSSRTPDQRIQESENIAKRVHPILGEAMYHTFTYLAFHLPISELFQPMDIAYNPPFVITDSGTYHYFKIMKKDTRIRVTTEELGHINALVEETLADKISKHEFVGIRSSIILDQHGIVKNPISIINVQDIGNSLLFTVAFNDTEQENLKNYTEYQKSLQSSMNNEPPASKLF